MKCVRWEHSPNGQDELDYTANEEDASNPLGDMWLPDLVRFLRHRLRFDGTSFIVSFILYFALK